MGRLNREGRGTRVEIHPLDQSQVPRPLQRVVGYRTMNVRRWDGIAASCSFTPSTRPQGLRPLRDPDADELDDDDDGGRWTAPEARSAPAPSHGGRAPGLTA